MTTITSEKHFITEPFVRATGSFGENAPPQLAAIRPKLLDLGQGRVAAMDEAAIDLQVLSLASMGLDALDPSTATVLVHDINDKTRGRRTRQPTRLGAFAALAPKSPSDAAAELDRCVTKLGFVGAMIDATSDSKFYDDPQFLPSSKPPQASMCQSTCTPRRHPSRLPGSTTPARPASSARCSRSPAGARTPRPVSTSCA